MRNEHSSATTSRYECVSLLSRRRKLWSHRIVAVVECAHMSINHLAGKGVGMWVLLNKNKTALHLGKSQEFLTGSLEKASRYQSVNTCLNGCVSVAQKIFTHSHPPLNQHYPFEMHRSLGCVQLIMTPQEFRELLTRCFLTKSGDPGAQTPFYKYAYKN